MTASTAALPRVPSTSGTAVVQLARLEAGRMLRSPAPWLGLAVSVWFARDVFGSSWAAAHYQGLVAAVTPLLLGITVAAAAAFSREHTAVCDDAPLTPAHRSLARLLGGLVWVAGTALVVAAVAGWLRLRGGLALGDEPGRTAHAHYTLPELLQPVLLAAFAVALGAVLARVLRSPLAGSVVAFVLWFLMGATYWLFNGPVLRWLTPVQVQPVPVVVGPAQTDPTTFPSTWLLSTPGEFQESWERLVVSPALAAWHDVYLVALTGLLVAALLRTRSRPALVAAALLLAAVAVAGQAVVTP